MGMTKVRKRVAAGAMAVGLVGIGTCTARTADDGGGMQATVKNQLPAGLSEGVADADFSTMSRSAAVAGDAFSSAGAPAAVTATAAAAAAGGASSGESASAPLPQGIGDPKVIKTAEIEVEVSEGRFDAAFSKVASIAAGLGGFVSSSTSSQAGDGDDDRQAAGSIVLRVPAEQFEAARTQLIALGELQGQQVKGDDVGGQLADLDARLRNLRSQEEAMRLLMTKAKTIGETIEVQRQLGSVREQIEQLAAQQARMSDAVAMSTITLHLAEPGAALVGENEPSPLGDAFSRAFEGAQDVLAGVIVALGYLLPLAVLLALAWLAARPFVGRRAGAPAEPAVSSS